MILKKITLDNYGLYRGKVCFNLSLESASKEQPIILFGGQNGAGKTTLFDAIRLAFYGKTSLGSRLTDNEYKEFLANKIHRSTSTVLHSNFAAISIDFEHVVLGECTNYTICRSWKSSERTKISEKLSIWKNGEALSGVTQDFWAGFIEEVIPERLSSLFFFDGEKIKSIADDTNGNAAMADSIKTLLGLDIIEKLKSDLSIYRSKQIKEQPNSNYKKEIDALGVEINELTEHSILLKEDLASNQTKIDGLQTIIRKTERRLRNEGSVFADQRESLVEQRAHIEACIEEQSRTIRHECETLFPFSLCPTLCEKLTKQLRAEQEGEKAQIVVNELDGILASLQNKLKNDPKLSTELSKDISNRLATYKKALSFKPLLKLSIKESEQISEWIRSSKEKSKPALNSALEKREEFICTLRKVEQHIQKAPDNSVLQPIITELNVLNTKLGMLQQKRCALEEEKRKTCNLLTDAERRLRKIQTANIQNDAFGKRIELTTRIDDALNDYATKLTQKKIEELRHTVTKCFNSLSRKGNLIKDIQIDPETFSVRLFDRYEHMLPKEELSAGEKQMFAVALLWGLSITSGRPLPVIIDTPLGRLDSAHRKTLIHNYFPNAAAQVIILSTDTEIDEQWYAELKPYVSKSFMLAHDTTDNCTSVKEQYFWS